MTFYAMDAGCRWLNKMDDFITKQKYNKNKVEINTIIYLNLSA